MSKQPLTDVSVCVFDAYGTLFDIGAIADLCRDALGPERATALIEMWRRKQLEYTWLRSLMGRHTDFWHITGESLDYAMRLQGLDDPLLRTRLMEGFLTPRPFPEVRDMLNALRAAGMKTAILSNGSPSMLMAALRSADIGTLFDAVLSVESVDVYKPHPSVYRLATDRFNVPNTAVAFMSANGWDAAGAAAYGFRVVWVNRFGQHRELLPATPDFELRSLAELPALLGL